MGFYDKHKLLIANRGEIAVRIIKTAKRLGLRTVAIYTPSDALSPHVLQADEAVPLPQDKTSSAASEAGSYLSAANIISICKERAVTLVHPGYGFLSENADFASLVVENGIIWLGPRPEVIRLMGIKHTARQAALDAGVDVVPGSNGLVETEEEALSLAREYGFPIMVKSTAGGGGMGMAICHDEDSLRKNFSVTQSRAKTLFSNDGVFLERYYPSARHIEIQIFGNGLGDVIHLRERECSVQRRHQKVIEETPSPFCASHPGLRERMCQAAVHLARSMRYSSAGTVEFLVDENSANFYFLEINTRIQVEHAITEEIHLRLDIVELMLKQGIAETSNTRGLSSGESEMQQETYDALYMESMSKGRSHSMQARIYAENPYENFVPSPGLLQHVSFDENDENGIRVDSWVETGITITPFFDPLLAKVIATGKTRHESMSKLLDALLHTKILGPINNMVHLRSIIQSDTFSAGRATTRFLETFSAGPYAFKVLASGIDATIQDLPGRTIRLGMPRSGPMDDVAFAVGNILAGNPRSTEGLEIIVVPGVGCAFHFFAPTVLSVTGKDVIVKVNGVKFPTWSRIVVASDSKVEITAYPINEASTGFRTYLCIRGGFPDIPLYLGSKSTSLGLGGYQGRSLMKGDYILLGDCSPSPTPTESETSAVLPKSLIPIFPSHWVIYVLSGPHDDEEFITTDGISKFYSTHWRISPSSNRLGIRLEAPTSADKIQWDRESGGEGGSHPSNILDNGYAPGTININGDTPVILTNEGPDMGGYVCICTVATAEMWKLGQLAPGCTVQFRRIPWTESRQRSVLNDEWLECVQRFVSGNNNPDLLPEPSPFLLSNLSDVHESPILHMQSSPGQDHLQVTFRQAGDCAILVEFGQMHLDILVRVRIHAFQTIIEEKKIPGIQTLCPCIRSILCYFDPSTIAQQNFMRILVEAERSIPENLEDLQFPARRFTFPIVLDDTWNKEALQRYMSTARDKAIYLPSNVDYLARNNGLSNKDETLQKLIASDLLVLGVGFYLACPFLVPIDPRCRLIGQKMNPSRTFTPRGAIGIAGPVSAIYPIESPGGYQLFGRTLPAWQTWGRGIDFHPTKPWLLEAFDQVKFVPIAEDEYLSLEQKFDAGQYQFQVESVTFSVREHMSFLVPIAKDVETFRERQKEASSQESTREQVLLKEWEESKNKQSVDPPSSLNDDIEDTVSLTASLFSTVWKIKCSPGDIVQSDSDVLLILEAMKTEIVVYAGEGNKGKQILGFGKGVKEGAAVKPGDVLVILK